MTKREEAVMKLGEGGAEFTVLDLVAVADGTNRTHALALLRRLERRGVVSCRQSEPDGTPGRPPLLWRLR